jgi:hypothetical protein
MVTKSAFWRSTQVPLGRVWRQYLGSLDALLGSQVLLWTTRAAAHRSKTEPDSAFIRLVHIHQVLAGALIHKPDDDLELFNWVRCAALDGLVASPAMHVAMRMRRVPWPWPSIAVGMPHCAPRTCLRGVS